jgi:hypothetical protein
VVSRSLTSIKSLERRVKDKVTGSYIGVRATQLNRWATRS